MPMPCLRTGQMMKKLLSNPHSGMVMKKCGMKYEGTLRSSDINNQGLNDSSWYAILRSDR